MKNLKKRWNQFCKGLVLWLFRFYKATFSWLFWGSCRYCPTCSEYTYQQIQKHGTIQGLYLGFRRILTCYG